MSGPNQAAEPAAPPERSAISRLEDALINIEGVAGVANCLSLMGASPYNDRAFTYLGGQLQEHHEAAREAFDEIFATGHKQPVGDPEPGNK